MSENITARDIRLAIVDGAIESGLAGAGVPVPRNYIAQRIREYRAAGVNNYVLECALINMRINMSGCPV